MTEKKDFSQLKNADIRFFPEFYDPVEAERLFLTLREELDWEYLKIRVFGKLHWQPRLTAFYAENGLSYSYSNLKLPTRDFPETLKIIKSRLWEERGIAFNSCLANLYRNGRDSNGWHADDEKELGKNPTIASLSFGAARQFKFRRKDNHREQFGIRLTSGSLLLMRGETQHFWQHQIPKTKQNIGQRINLTFRVLRPI